MVLVALLFAACTTEDGDEYDIPAGQSIFSQAILEVQPDGSPLVFAQVGMNYATSAPRPSWGRYRLRNVQCLAYSEGADGWESHSFRNLQSQFEVSSPLLQNWKGESEALILDDHRFLLYAREGDAWKVKRAQASDPNESLGEYGPLFSDVEAVVLEGDSAWQTLIATVSGSPPTPWLEIRRNNGTLIELDTVDLYGSAHLLLAGKETNHLIVSDTYGNGDSLSTQSFRCYRWSLDPAHPDPRKQVLTLQHRAVFGNLFSSQVLGETRIYYRLSMDSLAEFGIRNDTLALLGYRLFPAAADTSGADPNPRYAAGNLNVDPLGCIHSMGEVRMGNSPNGAPIFVHASSCEAAADTAYPPYPKVGFFDSRISDLRFARDGSPMVSLTMAEINPPDDSQQDTLRPSWLYLGRLGAGHKWVWEKIAAY